MLWQTCTTKHRSSVLLPQQQHDMLILLRTDALPNNVYPLLSAPLAVSLFCF